ncbi:MAG: histidine ammonia-lyase [Crocinitomicaceae bacterium]|nr:histidine ammonia-lyase [Crocinitomicaceae bacterium]
MKTVIIDRKWLRLDEIEEILSNSTKLQLDEDTKNEIQKCRDFLDKKVEKSKELIYGVNTGFGSLCNTAVSKDDLSTLQSNLVRSHACGMGEIVPFEIVKRMLLLKVLGLSHGKSGVQVQTVERLIYFFNNDILPVVYQQGSLGASGDLAPLAHLSLPLLGEGEVLYNGTIRATSEVYAELNLTPIVLQSKEGLALLNGTQFMSAFASYSIANCFKLWHQFNVIGAMSLEAYDGRLNPFNENVNAIRNQKGQMEVAAQFRSILDGSQLIARHKEHVQDPYSFRCIPQVHGASYDTFKHCAKIIEREINAVTDNPTVFPEDDEVVSAGNFHGQPLALVMDFMAIAIAEMGSISERRVYKLISGTRGLPAFLVANPGLNSGFMIPQYTCASIVSQNKQLCTPASVDTIDSSNGQEDHVSMGANAATKLYRVIENCYSIQGIELINAAQALEFRRPLKSSKTIEKIHEEYRKVIPFIDKDTYFHPLLETSKQFVKHLILI